MDVDKARRVAEALGYEESKASDLGIYSKGEYISPDSIGRIAALLDERDKLRLALTAIGDKAVVDWDDETVGQVAAVISKPEGKHKETYIEWFRKAMARAEEFDALRAELAAAKNTIHEMTISLGKDPSNIPCKCYNQTRLVWGSSSISYVEDLRAELAEAKAEVERLRGQCAGLRGWLRGIMQYGREEVVKDEFAYDRLLETVKDAAKQALAEFPGEAQP